MQKILLVALAIIAVAVGITYTTTSATTQNLSTPDGALFLTIDLQVDPAKVDEFLAVMIEAAPDTRNREGCRLFDIYVDQNKPGHIVFYEIWDSKAHQQAYIAWRNETGFNERIGPYMVEGGHGLTYFDKVDG